MEKADSALVALRIVTGMLDVMAKRDPTFASAVADAVRPYLDSQIDESGRMVVQAALNRIAVAG
jgi:hypothetical protein